MTVMEMKEREMTPGESVRLIASMIESTRMRLTKGEGNMLLFWGYLCVAVAVLVYIGNMLCIKYGGEGLWISQLLWWLIPLVGIPYTLAVSRRNSGKRGAISYSDRLSASLWSYVLWLALATFVIGAFFFVSGFRVWYVFQLFAFFVVGMAASFQGIIIREKSMVWGGGFSVVCGGFLVAGVLSGASMLTVFSTPLFIISFVVMMIIPGYILNHKASKEDERA